MCAVNTAYLCPIFHCTLTQQKDEYITRLQLEGEGLRRRLAEVASVRRMHWHFSTFSCVMAMVVMVMVLVCLQGLPQSLEQEFLQLRKENKRLQVCEWGAESCSVNELTNMCEC